MMCKSIYFLFFVLTSALASKEIRQIVDGILKNYDKSVRPDQNTGRREINGLDIVIPELKPVNIQMEVAVLDVYNFDEINHQVTLSLYLRHKWNDMRLAYDYNEAKGVKSYFLNVDEAKKIWKPDTFIANERSVVKHDYSRPNEFTRVQYTGDVLLSERLTVTIGCILYLRWYPFDQNVCSTDFESYGFTTDDMKYSWAKDSKNESKIWVSKEAYQGIRHKITAFRGKDVSETLSTGTYQRVSMELNFKRLSFRYLLEVYFPSIAIPIVAFITLCVGGLEFRVLLSTICMFMMVTFAIVFRIGHVQVDYKTALDFYVFNSSVTVFNVVLVNFFMYYLLKPKPSPAQMRMRQLNGSREEGKGILADEESTTEDANGGANTSNSATSAPRFPNKTMELSYKFIEKSYLTMPIFFLIFNVLYWPIVLIASSGLPVDFIPTESRGL